MNTGASLSIDSGNRSEVMAAEVPGVRGEGHRVFLCHGSDPGERGDAGGRIFKGEKWRNSEAR